MAAGFTDHERALIAFDQLLRFIVETDMHSTPDMLEILKSRIIVAGFSKTLTQTLLDLTDYIATHGGVDEPETN